MRGLAAGLLLAMLVVPEASAHPGGLNAEGCHNDRKNGGYHCHRAPAARPASFADATPARRANFGSTFGAAFRNCAAARAAGAAPVRAGDPGYGPHLDRDG